MILHTLNTGSLSTAFADCLRIASRGDAILLTGDAVYAALDHTGACTALENHAAEIFVLESDAHAAGILERLSQEFVPVDFDGFVSLSERFPRQMAWY